MKLNTTLMIPAGYTPPPLPAELCGPQVLAEILIHARKLLHTWSGPISDGGIRTLVDLVFYASLMPEEGCYPRYKLVCQQAEDSFFLVTRIDPFKLHGVNQIRRLAPACAHPDCALLVTEHGGSLWCDGVINVGGMGYETAPGRPGVIGVGHPPRLHLEVLGPGHLRGAETTFGAYEIRAGRIRAVSAFYSPEPVWNLIDSFRVRIRSEVLARLGEEGEKYRTWADDARPVIHVLARILRAASDARRGGAFVILPDERIQPGEYGMEIPYRTTNLDLRTDLIEHFICCLQSDQQYGASDWENTLRRSEVLRSRLLSNAEAVGRFSCVDGCVVLTREFNILGFGAKIDAPVDQANESPRRFKHIATGEVYEDTTFMSSIGGTRHQSAARLCQIYPGMMVLALSQDGDLKLFTSDEQFAYAYGPLDLPTTQNLIDV